MRRLYGILMVVVMVLVPTAATALAEGPPPQQESASQTTAPAPAPAPVATPAPAAEPAPAPEPTSTSQPPLKQGSPSPPRRCRRKRAAASPPGRSRPPSPSPKRNRGRPKRRRRRRRRRRTGRRRHRDRSSLGLLDPLDPELQLRGRRRSAGAAADLPAGGDAYGLGPQGPSVLAAINLVETAFGTNLNVSSAGAIGWMQFEPSTWEMYGVDANGDGTKDPYDPEDAIFAAASYLKAAGMPEDTYGAIYSYNHADWYVAEVLSNAECFGQLGNGAGAASAFNLAPKLEVLECQAAKPWREPDPARLPRRFPGRGRPLRPRRTRRLGAGLGRAAGVRLRPRDEQAGTGTARPARPRWDRVDELHASTATATAGSATPTPPTRPPPWRG